MTETTKIYDAGYIYGIYHQDNLKYIGSTINFKERMWLHKSNCYNVNDRHSNVKIYQYIRENGVWEDFEFKIIDVYYTITKQLLNKIEGEYIKYFGYDNLLNSDIPGRTLVEYREDNKEKIKIKAKKYREDNKVRDKKYREDNKEKNKKYNQDNKDKIKAQISRPWTCSICNKTVNTGSKSRHLKGPRHLKKANEINLI